MQPRGPVPIGSAIDAFLRSSGLHRRPLDRRVFDAWDEAAGDLARRAVPVAFRRGELVVEVDSSTLLQELRFQGPGLRDHTNRILGAERVRRLRLRPGAGGPAADRARREPGGTSTRRGRGRA